MAVIIPSSLGWILFTALPLLLWMMLLSCGDSCPPFFSTNKYIFLLLFSYSRCLLHILLANKLVLDCVVKRISFFLFSFSIFFYPLAIFCLLLLLFFLVLKAVLVEIEFSYGRYSLQLLELGILVQCLLLEAVLAFSSACRP